tara:strand:+ start:5912 stop:7246 length:1335 start_codon:yes stop_codon:yes gene_type:complete
MRKLLKNNSAPPIFLGAFIGVITLLPFMRVRVNYEYIELSGALQFIVFVGLFVGLIAFANFRFSELFSEFKYLSLNQSCLLFLLWCAVAVISSFVGQDPILSLKRATLALVPACLVYFTAYSCADPRKILKGFVLGMCLITLVSIFYALAGWIAEITNTDPNVRHGTFFLFGLEFSQSLGQRHILFNNELIELQRFSGFYPNPNGIGIVSAICLIFLTLIKKDMPRTYVFLLVVMVLGLLLSGSRMSLLLVISSCAYFILSPRLRTKIFNVPSAILVFLFLIVLIFVWAEFSQEISNMFDGSRQEFLSLGERGNGFLKAIEVASQNWFIGSGFGLGAEVVFGKQADVMAIHSVILNAIVETGFLGAILISALWVRPLISEHKVTTAEHSKDLQTLCLNAVVFGLLVAELFDLSVTRFHYIHLVLFFLLGLSSAFQRRGRKRIET